MADPRPPAASHEECRTALPLRLKKRPDFLRAAAGRKVHVGLVSLHVARRPEGTGESTRVGFTVTKKTGGAVERNRIRRRLRDVVRTVPDLCMLPSHDYVIIARQGVLTASHAAIVSELRRAMRRVQPAPGRDRPPGSKDRGDARLTVD